MSAVTKMLCQANALMDDRDWCVRDFCKFLFLHAYAEHAERFKLSLDMSTREFRRKN